MLLGDHNVANALAAALAVMGADPAHRTDDARARVAGALRAFRALEHRIEPAGLYDDVEWINDSKSTNVASTLVALQGHAPAHRAAARRPAQGRAVHARSPTSCGAP